MALPMRCLCYWSSKIAFKKFIPSLHCTVLQCNYHKGFKLFQNQNIPQSSSESESDSEYEHSTNIREVKLEILKEALKFVPEHGWSKKSLAAGAESLGLSVAAQGMFTYGGADLICYFNLSSNGKLEGILKTKYENGLHKVDLHTYLEDVLKQRLEMIIPYAPKWPEAMAIMAQPQNVKSDLDCLMDLASTIWFYAQDKNLNFRWYTKRFSLATAYKACELCLVQDASPDYSLTWDFLQQRIEMVIRSENFLHEVQDSCNVASEVSSGALITLRNLLGMNRLFR